MQIQLRRTGKIWLYQFRMKGCPWRSLNQKNIMPADLSPAFTEKYRAALNRVIKGETVLVQASIHDGTIIVKEA